MKHGYRADTYLTTKFAFIVQDCWLLYSNVPKTATEISSEVTDTICHFLAIKYATGPFTFCNILHTIDLWILWSGYFALNVLGTVFEENFPESKTISTLLSFVTMEGVAVMKQAVSSGRTNCKFRRNDRHRNFEGQQSYWLLIIASTRSG